MLRDHHGQSFERRQGVKQLVDLERAHHAAFDPQVRCQVGDVLPFQHDTAFGRFQHASEQIDQRGFARAVGADQRVAGTPSQIERDIVGGGDATKALVQALGR